MSLSKTLPLLFFALMSQYVQGVSFSPGKADFSVSIKSLNIPYGEFSIFAVPGERLTLEVVRGGGRYEYSLETTLQNVPKHNGAWELRVPEKAGHYPVTVARKGTNDRISLNIFSTVPGSRVKNEHLNGYRIGKYPGILTGKPYVTRPPSHFVEVTADNENMPVSPHFKLGQFLCKQPGGFPKYLVLDEILVLKLELILEELNRRGHAADTLHIMSGYRTPYYNKAIGNVDYSRHLWGKAADIFIDAAPADDMMDDLNRDGAVDKKDAKFFYDMVDSLVGKKWYENFLGGLGHYGSTASHGPFIHVDSRGYKARW